MPDLRRPSLRLALGLAVVVAALVEIQALTQTLRSQARLRERVVRSQRDAVAAALPRLSAVLRPGGPSAWEEAAHEVLRAALATEVEVFDASGRLLLARPSSSPAGEAPPPAGLRLGEPSVLTLGPYERGWRLLSYVSLPSGDHAVVLRLSNAVPELVEDLRERRQLVIGHGVALAILLLAGGMALFPGASEPASSVPQALHAYEEAMERLRDRGLELSREHEQERRRMEEEIRDKEALARAGELTAGIVHEVRNGLGTILGYARLLEREPPSPEAVDAARRIREECETLETVVRRFMDFVRRETLNLAAFDLNRMLARVAARETRGHPGAEVELPASGPDGEIVGDEELLERAFENLVRNAREAAGVGGRVVLHIGRDGERRVVRIADDGPGLSPEARKALRPFLSTRAGGLGLGLPIALKIVRLHAGELELSDSHPRGLVVTVRLPAAGPKT